MKICGVFSAGILTLFLSACASTPGAPEPAPVSEVPAAPPAPVYVLDDFLGQSQAAIDEKLGAPALTRREGSGEFRRYRLNQCSLIIILYPDDDGRDRAAHVEATALSADQEKPDLDDCLAAG